MERYACPCCLELTLEVRFDVKGRPYCTCTSCSARIFLRGTQSLVGIAMVSPLIEAMVEETKTSREAWQRMQETRERVARSLRTTSPETTTTTTAADLAVAAGAAR